MITKRFILPAWTLTQREIIRFVRQRNRVFSALGQPIFFWILFGSGFEASFKSEHFGKMGYQEYFFPGTLAMILLFTAIFATISIIEDRNEGFLQGVLVSPAPRSAMVFGKIMGGTILAFGQALLFLCLAPVAGVPLTITSFFATAGILFLIAFALTGLGFTIAWRMKSTQGFHAIMMVFLLPMWLLSGAFFPGQGAPTWLAWVIKLNPLSYGVAGLRRLLYLSLPPGTEVPNYQDLPSLSLSLAVTVGFCLFTLCTASMVASVRSTGDA
jgi:ABC-2 type transport system permease protein